MSGLEECASYVAGAGAWHIVTENREAELRQRCAEGDVAIVVADFPGRDRLLRRMEAWKVGRIWVGSGPTPPLGLVDAAWIDAPPDAAAQIVAAAPSQCPQSILEDRGEDSCITCRDEGVVGEVTQTGVGGTALVRFGDAEEEVDTAMVGELGEHALVLVHAGVAIAAWEEEREGA